MCNVFACAALSQTQTIYVYLKKKKNCYTPQRRVYNLEIRRDTNEKKSTRNCIRKYPNHLKIHHPK